MYLVHCVCAEADVSRCRAELVQEAKTIACLRSLQREAAASAQVIQQIQEGMPKHLLDSAISTPADSAELRERNPNLVTEVDTTSKETAQRSLAASRAAKTVLCTPCHAHVGERMHCTVTVLRARPFQSQLIHRRVRCLSWFR